MDKIFDVIFSPRNFFRVPKYKPLDSLFVILVIWITNALILYPLLKSTPFFGKYVLLSLIVLGLFFVYCIFAIAIHLIIGKANRNVTIGFPYVMVPHVMSGWIFSLTLNGKWLSLLYLIPLVWSVMLEFYLVRSSTIHGILYTIVVRVARDVIFLLGVYAFLRGWII